MAITIKGVFSALKAQGYTGADSDAQALAKYALDNDIEIKDKDGNAVDILKLAKPAPAKKAVTIEAEPDAPAPEPVNVEEVVQKALTGLEAKIAKGFGLNRPDFTPVTVGKSGAERRYDNRIATGHAKFKSYEDAKGFSDWLGHRVLLGQNKPELARKAFASFSEFATRKGFTGSVMGEGGALVPDYFEADLQNLILSYGVARRLCRVVRTTTDNYARPRASGDLGVYYPSEGSAMTDSSSLRTYDQIKGTVKTGTVLAKMSRQINDDAAIDIMEDVVSSITRSIAKLEDETLFNGTGAGAGSPSTYIPGVTGIVRTFGTTATEDSRSTTGGDNMGAHSLANLMTLMGLPGNFGGMNNVFICSPVALTNILFRLGLAQGGVTYAEYANFGSVPRVLGRPVIVTEVMNKTLSLGSDLTDVLYGDPSFAATFVERQGIEIDVSDQRYWDELNLGVRGVVRHDINVHDLGSTSVQGPLGALFQT